MSSWETWMVHKDSKNDLSIKKPQDASSTHDRSKVSVCNDTFGFGDLKLKKVSTNEVTVKTSKDESVSPDQSKSELSPDTKQCIGNDASGLSDLKLKKGLRRKGCPKTPVKQVRTDKNKRIAEFKSELSAPATSTYLERARSWMSCLDVKLPVPPFTTLPDFSSFTSDVETYYGNYKTFLERFSPTEVVFEESNMLRITEATALDLFRESWLTDGLVGQLMMPYNNDQVKVMHSLFLQLEESTFKMVKFLNCK